MWRFARSFSAALRFPAFSRRLRPFASVYRIHQMPLPFSLSKIPRFAVIFPNYRTGFPHSIVRCIIVPFEESNPERSSAEESAVSQPTSEHFYLCASCRQAVDKRDLGQVLHHEVPRPQPAALLLKSRQSGSQLLQAGHSTSLSETQVSHLLVIPGDVTGLGDRS